MCACRLGNLPPQAMNHTRLLHLVVEHDSFALTVNANTLANEQTFDTAPSTPRLRRRAFDARRASDSNASDTAPTTPSLRFLSKILNAIINANENENDHEQRQDLDNTRTRPRLVRTSRIRIRS